MWEFWGPATAQGIQQARRLVIIAQINYVVKGHSINKGQRPNPTASTLPIHPRKFWQIYTWCFKEENKNILHSLKNTSLKNENQTKWEITS